MFWNDFMWFDPIMCMLIWTKSRFNYYIIIWETWNYDFVLWDAVLLKHNYLSFSRLEIVWQSWESTTKSMLQSQQGNSLKARSKVWDNFC